MNLLDILKNQYNSTFSSESKTHCLIHYYRYRNGNVRTYFDNYDNLSPSLSVILSYGDEKFFTPLNIKKLVVKGNQFIDGLKPYHIIRKHITVNYHLNDFFKTMKDYLLNEKSIPGRYGSGYIHEASDFSSKESYKPFWAGFRKVRMSDHNKHVISNMSEDTRNTNISISYSDLNKIQNAGLTLVRTSDPTRRKKLGAIIQSIKNEYKINL